MKKLMTVLFITVLLAGCGGSIATQYRKEGVSLIHKGFFKHLDKEPRLHKVIVVKYLAIHVVGDRKHFDVEKFKDPKAEGYLPNVIGYARQRNGINEIYVWGTMKDGKIVINLQNLGHEMGHILRMNNVLVLDPHDFDDSGV